MARLLWDARFAALCFRAIPAYGSEPVTGAANEDIECDEVRWTLKNLPKGHYTTSFGG